MKTRAKQTKRLKQVYRHPASSSKLTRTQFNKNETQAERILSRFGGARALSRLLALTGYRKTPSAIYRWLYPREKGGTGGVIPTCVIPYLVRAARYGGVLLTELDLDPRSRVVPKQPLGLD